MPIILASPEEFGLQSGRIGAPPATRRLSVEVVMTRAACEFITSATFAALTGKKLLLDCSPNPNGEANLESAIETHRRGQRNRPSAGRRQPPRTSSPNSAAAFSDDFLSTLYLATLLRSSSPRQ